MPNRDRMKREASRERVRQLRENEEYRAQEQERNTSAHHTARESLAFRTPERERDAAAHRTARQRPAFRTPENDRDAAAHRTARQNPAIRTPERERDAAAHRTARQNPAFRISESERDTEAHRTTRQNPAVRIPERERDAAAHRTARESPAFRTPESQRDAAAHRTARQNPLIRTPEKERDAAARRIARTNEQSRLIEKEKDAIAHRIVRQNPQKRKLEFSNIADQKQKRIKSLSYEELKCCFENEIREQPNYICPCCGRLLYKFQTHVIRIPDLLITRSEDYIKSIICAPIPVIVNKLRFCDTCKSSIKIGKIPRLALSNGLDFPVLPPELCDLSQLEERLVALRIPFMQIRPLGFAQQSQLKGNVVNVENDLDITTKVIPRQFDETSTVQVQLMRRMAYRQPYMFETVRPWKVHQAAMYLVKTELYIEENVKLSNHLSESSLDDKVDFICSRDSAPGDSGVEIEDRGECESNDLSSVTVEIIGADESLIYNRTDFNHLSCIRIAPGEGKRPLLIPCDPRAEEKSFPTVYGGEGRKVNQENKEGQRRLSYTDIAKSEIMRYDRRACTPTKVLYAFKKSFNEKVSQCITTFLRKKRGNQGNYKAFQVRDASFLRSIVENDEGYSVFKNLRSTPSYWAAKCKKVIAMVRQLGKCSLFITLSAAETRWNELLVLLMKLIKNKEITEEDAEKLTTEQKNELIRLDPVTCMRHFDRRYQALFKNLFNSKNGIFSPHELSDFFHRLEYQMRGSPHSHGLYWLNNAPQYEEGNEESAQACVEFIDKYITCARNYDDETKKYVKYQIHQHSHTCRKGMPDRLNCRFNFPKPPLPHTQILHPLPKELSSQKRKHYANMYDNIKADLNQRGRNPKDNPSFSDYLLSLGMSESDYVLAIRSSVKRVTVFNKRNVDEAFVNPYNPSLLCAWKANIDIQFVLDTYACAKYCVGYILKSDGGLSKLMKQINHSAAQGNEQICNKLESYGKVLWNGTEISAQEAAGFLLGIKNVNSSRCDVYIDTSPPQERTHILKSAEELGALKDDDENVYQSGLLDHYINRPEQIKKMCLAEFASNYNFSKSKPGNKNKNDPSTEGEIIIPDEDHSNGKIEPICYELVDGSGFITKRGSRKIIRYRHYSQKQDPLNFWREQLMLYVPWRNEEDDLININHIQRAAENMNDIEHQAAIFHYDQNFSDDTLRNLVDEITEEADAHETGDDNDDIIGHLEEQDNVADLMLNAHNPTTPNKKIVQFLPPKLIAHEEYHNIMRSLNMKQRKFVLNVLHLLKTTRDPFYMFLSGGAGVGKSLAITAIVQSALRFYGAEPGKDMSSLPVIVTAFTGKAAFNVFGMTLHSAFRLPPIQKTEMSDLHDDLRNSLHAKLKHLKLIIIDEISMCSLKLLKYVDHRMKQVKGSDDDFGGISVLVVGHLRQLSPICGQYPFENERGKEGCVNYLWRKFRIFEFDEIMRQQGELKMCKALNNMSEGIMDNDDLELMRSRQISQSNQPPPNAIWLFHTNKECDRHNQKVHGLLDTEGFLSIANDYVEGKASMQRKQRLLLDAQNLSQQDCDGLRYTTSLKVKANFFISTNIDVQDGLFNGATGKLMHLEKREPNIVSDNCATCPIVRVWMMFENPLIGSEKRTSFLSSHRGKLPSNVDPSWTPIEKIKKPLSKLYSDNLKLVRSQFPLVACDGMTVAKSQGSSLETVVVSITGSKLSRAELYVACSRATSLQGLYIDGYFNAPGPPTFPDIAGKEMERLRLNPLQLTLRYLQDCDSKLEKMYFHNIQSLGQHILDISADHCGMASDLIILVEPHLLHSDVYELPGFHVVHRVNCSAARNSEGILLLARDPQKAHVLDCFTNFKGDSHTIILKFKTGLVTVMAVYKHPRYPMHSFFPLLEEILNSVTGKAILVGDINIDLLNGQNKSVFECLQKFGFSSRLNANTATTNAGTQIDCCFANFTPDVFTYETYYSYHKAICVTFSE